MFTKKYIFETKKTRAQRILRAIFFTSIVFATSFALLAIYLPIYAKNQNNLSKQAFFQRSPDLIAVFTGDVGRIDYTLKKAERYPSARVFITGVYAKNSLKTLLVQQGKNISVQDYLTQESHHIQLDYLARNTIENGIATIRYLETLADYKNILIISSDYHMFRISRIMNALNHNPNLSFYYESIESDYTKKPNLIKLIKEVYKLFKTSTFLMFWDQEPMLRID